MALSIDVILSVVLPKLPSKSLMRFKRVCRSFNTTISSSEFINVYLSPCLSSNVNRFLILPRTTDGLYYYNLDSQEPPLITYLHLPSTFNSFLSEYVSVIGSCNGLLCISKGYAPTRHFMLLNPFTGKFWEIPFVGFFENQLISNFGFGYDAANGDHKIVSFFDYVREDGAEMRGARVYSLKAGSWGQVESIITIRSNIRWYNRVVLLGNDLLHCIFTSLSYQERLPHIGCFDIGSETWREDVMMPMYYIEHGYNQFEAIWHDIGVLDECLYSSFMNASAYKLDVWIMKQHCVSESWVFLFSISLLRFPAGIIFPIAYRKGSNDEVLLGGNYPPKLLWYNTSSDETVEVELKEVPELSNSRAWICIGNPGDQIGKPI